MKNKKEKMNNIQKWELLERKEVFSFKPWGSVHLDKVRLPTGRVLDDYYHIKLPSYVMVCAKNEEGKWILVREYKHGIGDITFLFPAGFVEENESHLNAAQRELKEETGYEASQWVYMGAFHTDGARGGGKAHFYYANHLKKSFLPKKDDAEVSEIHFLTDQEFMEAIKAGQICLLSAVCAFSFTTNPQMRDFFNLR